MINAGIPKSIWLKILAAIIKITNRTATPHSFGYNFI